VLGVPDLSIFWVFQLPIIPEVDTEKLVWVSGFCQFSPGGRTISFDIILCLMLRKEEDGQMPVLAKVGTGLHQNNL
jgi:hypothetical protein